MKNTRRRGVLLLVVLALLAMFAMVAVAFVVLTGVEKTTALRVRKLGEVDNRPDKTLHQAFNVVVRGTPINPQTLAPVASAITWQSLLEKEYGFTTIGSLLAPATLASPTPVCGGQLIEFSLPGTNPDTVFFSGATIDPFHYVGCVLTMLDGPAAGLSTRIVGINPQSLKVQMVAFEGGVQPVNGNHYIVNGFPYSGMGFGFNTGSGGLTPLSLMPNAPPASWGPGNKGIVPGGPNSDYTGPDYQDPIIALAVPHYNNAGITDGIRVPIPSLHRADLIAHTNAMGNVTLLRQVMFRPNKFDHPNFTGSNPNFNPIWDGITPGQGQWDVDNDGDGVPDSVWVDLGMPVRYTADGQAYKPLFAILCLDLDGRLNLNAHGSYAQTQQGYYQPIKLQGYQPLSSPPGSGATLDVGIGTTPPQMAYFAGTAGSQVSTATVLLPRGQGSGPAEVNLLPLFRNPYSAGSFLLPNFQAVLSGSGALMGRYGPPLPSGQIGSALPGVNGSGSPLSLNHAFPYNGVMGGTYWTHFQSIYDAHGSPPDHQTFGAVALDHAGRPLYISMGGPVANGPYDIDLTRNAAHAVSQPNTPDNPFGVAELESLLRSYDRDAGMFPQRLISLTNSGTGSFLVPRRAELTSESWMVPTASAVLPPTLRINNLPNNQSVHPVDIIAAKIQQSGGNLNNLNAIRLQLLPWEVLQGLKMNLNRPFGPGAFSSPSNGTLIQGGQKTIPDQPGSQGENVQQLITSGGGPVAVPMNYSADAGLVSQVNGVAVRDSLTARQLYARHLYVLMMAVADTKAMLSDLQKTNSTASSDDVARQIAQWAINVVAYRDHNGIMIPFPYDPNPFSGVGSGWNPDNTPLHTVWGCKRPELLITETLAFHDRRTQDLSDEVLDKKKPGGSARTKPGLTTDKNAKSHDPSFNSRYRPQGSLFVELYHPWTMIEPRTTDLAPSVAGGGNSGVELTKKTPAVNGKSSPVWRLVIVDPSKNAAPSNGDELPDLDNFIVTSRPTIERVAYFVSLAGLTYPTTDGQVTYSVSVNTSIVVPPSGYAVVGSGDPTQQNRTYIGFENGKTAGSPTTTRMVTMNQADLADARVIRNTSDPRPNANPPQVLGIDTAMYQGSTALRRLSVSEPTRGYTPYEIDGNNKPAAYIAATGAYNETLDIPVDAQRDPTYAPGVPGNEPGIWATLNTNATVPAFRIVYLQRLADPTRPFASDVPGTAGYSSDPRSWNPYRTVDAMTVDLTCFDGLTSALDPTTKPGAYHFESHQRGEKNYLPSYPTEANLWKQEPALKGVPSPVPNWGWKPAGWSGGGAAPNGNHYFTQPLNQTLGYLNAPFGKPATSPAGDPQYPFPWMDWSYRPFNNEYELLLVPTVSSSKLLARNTIDPRRYYGYVDGAVRGDQYGW